MTKRIKKENKIVKVILIILGVLIFISSIVAFTGYYYYEDRIVYYQETIKEIETKLKDSFIGDNIVIEYGDTWSYLDFINKYLNLDKLNYNYEIKLNDNIIKDDYQFLNIGDNKIEINIDTNYQYKIFKEYKKVISQNKSYIITVSDSNYPIIEGVLDKTITVGDSINLKENITAYDVIDGALDIKIDGSVDNTKAGVYEIKVSATDKNNNLTSQTFKVTVKEKPVVNNKPQSNNNNNNSQNNNNQNNNDASTLQGRLNLAKAEAKKVVASIITPGMSDYDKARAICDYLYLNVAHQLNQSTEAYKTNFGNEAYAALIMKIAACSGFCKAVTLLCNEAGLQSKHINANEWTHQWNLVLIDGVWYHLDSQIGALYEETDL